VLEHEDASEATGRGRASDEPHECYDNAMVLSRREILGAGIGAAGAAAIGTTGLLSAPARADGWRAFARAGRVARVRHEDPLVGGGAMKAGVAGEMLDRAVKALTGEGSSADAWRKIVRPDDQVALKPNGLGGRTMATHKELLDATIEALLGIGVPADHITIYEQYMGFLRACGVRPNNVPEGVRQRVHENRDAPREWTSVPSGRTKYVRPLLEATAVIAFPLVKDHSIAGITGCLKNMTHGSVVNPHEFHRHNASPQIAELYAHDAIRSRVRLHVLDATRILCNGGPRDDPSFRRPSDELYVSTDPVALDTIAIGLVEADRRTRRLPSLTARGTPPAHVAAAEPLGLGTREARTIEG
jgi:uncharacterized protein (DUF362 family)